MQEEILKSDGLPVLEELVGLHSINPFIKENSSSRSYMFSSHLSQSLTPLFSEEKIIQTGLETQLGQNTHNKRIDDDVKILKIIKRYNGISAGNVNKCVETLLITENLETGLIDYISIPYYNKLHTEFGFKYEIKPILDNLRTGDILKAGTILADSPGVKEGGGYGYGVNANLCLLNIPETAEDGVIISKSLSEKLSYRSYEERAIEFGSKAFPLNIYGDENEYKPFPEIGDLVCDDSILCALRNYDKELSPGLTSVNDVRDFNPMFDNAVYVKAPGREVTLQGEKFYTGRVVDVKVYSNPKYKREVYSGVSGFVDKYANALKIYYKSILEAYEDIKTNHTHRHGNINLNLSNKLHRLIIDAMAIAGADSKKISYSNRNETMDLYRVVFVVEYIGLSSTGALTISNKISDSHGNL